MGKTRITIRLDDDVLSWFRGQVRSSGGSYQTLINLSLRDYIAREPLEATLRRVIRGELARAQGRPSSDAYGYAISPAALVADSDAAELRQPSKGQDRSQTRRRRRD